MSGFTTKRVRNARMRTKTNQTGLKMQGNPATIGRSNVLKRQINTRVQTTWGLCGRPGDMGFRCRYGVNPSTAGEEALKKYCKFCATPDRFCLNEAPKHQGMSGGVGRINAPRFRCNGCGADSNHPHIRPKPPPPPPPPPQATVYEIYYGAGTENQQIINTRAAVLVTEKTSASPNFRIIYIKRKDSDFPNGKIVWKPNDLSPILKGVYFTIEQVNGQTLLGHKLFTGVQNLATYVHGTGEIVFHPNNFPNATTTGGNLSLFKLKFTCSFKDPKTKSVSNTITESGQIKVTTRINKPIQPAHNSALSFDVMYTNSKSGASLKTLLNSSNDAHLGDIAISFKELMNTTDLLGNKPKFELAPNFLQVASGGDNFGGFAESGICPKSGCSSKCEPENGNVLDTPTGTINGNFPTAQQLLSELQQYFPSLVDKGRIRKGATFMGSKEAGVGANIYNCNFDFGNPEFVTYFKHATGIAVHSEWPKWTGKYLSTLSELDFIYHKTESNQSLVTNDKTRKSILVTGACIDVGSGQKNPPPLALTTKDYTWVNAADSSDEGARLLGFYKLYTDPSIGDKPDIYFAGGASHASAPAKQFYATEVTYSAIQNYEINTTGYCNKCGDLKQATLDVCKHCLTRAPPHPYTFGTWQNKQIGQHGEFGPVKLQQFAHKVAHQIFEVSTDFNSPGCYGLEAAWLQNLRDAGGKTIPVIAVGGGASGAANIGFHSKLIPYLLYEMDIIFKKYDNPPEKVGLFHASENFTPCPQ